MDTEQLRSALARRYTWRTLDTISYETGLLCQRAGVPYRGRVTPGERAAVEQVTAREQIGRRQKNGVDREQAWKECQAEGCGAALAALAALVIFALLSVGLLCVALFFLI